MNVTARWQLAYVKMDGWVLDVKHQIAVLIRFAMDLAFVMVTIIHHLDVSIALTTEWEKLVKKLA